MPVVLAIPHTKRECWVLAGFEPRDEPERHRLVEARRDLGFDPTTRADRLTAQKEQAKTSAKRVLGYLTNSDAARERACWAETDLERFFSKSEVARSEEDLSGPVSIAVALTAEVKETAEEAAEEGDDAKDADEKKQARLVVFGDAAFIDNEYIHKMYNADLFLNTINWLAEEEALISIRPKTTRGSRVLMTPKETRDIFYMSVLILPEILLLFGLAIWWRRR